MRTYATYAARAKRFLARHATPADPPAPAPMDTENSRSHAVVIAHGPWGAVIHVFDACYEDAHRGLVALAQKHIDELGHRGGITVLESNEPISKEKLDDLVHAVTGLDKSHWRENEEYTPIYHTLEDNDIELFTEHLF